MAGLVCSAIVGFLCLQTPIGGQVDVKLFDQGIYVTDTIEAKDWTLSWSRSMERAPPRLDTAKLAKGCDGETCVLYWRKCSDVQCSFAVVADGGVDHYFDIAMKGADGQKHALEAIRIIVDLKQGTTVPLSKLDRDGPGGTAPVLPPDSQAPL